MPRDHQTTPDTATTQDGYDLPSALVTDPDAGAKAAALAVDREAPTPQLRWEQLFGKFLGDKLYEVVKDKASAADFMRLGKDALDSAIRSLGSKVTDAARGGSITDRLDAELIASTLKAELGPMAAAYMTTGPGRELAEEIGKYIEGSPLAVIGALLLAGAVAVASDMRVPELKTTIGLGHGFSVGVDAELGSFRHLMVQRLGADLTYAGQGWKLKLGAERDAGDAAKDALNKGGNPTLLSGAFDDHTVIDKLTADLDFQIRAITGSNVHLSNETLLQHGQPLSGNIGARFTAPIGDELKVGVGASQHYGSLNNGIASLDATYQPRPGESFSLGVTQGFGPHNTGTGVQFKMQINQNVLFEGHYDKKDGAWAGVVIRIPL